MRLVLRVLLFEFLLSWAMMLAGSLRVATQICAFTAHSLKARFQRPGWRLGLGLTIAIPVVAGWPALFLPTQTEYASGDWLVIAIPWWVVIGVLGAEMLAVRLTSGK
jgi:hypothetical protein